MPSFFSFFLSSRLAIVLHRTFAATALPPPSHPHHIILATPFSKCELSHLPVVVSSLSEHSPHLSSSSSSAVQ
ncbi:hypothetical protein M407DRAFT_244612 [Tulasnella calospora MUT 4182]|uniref:Secreted protein n=1 Tax=Tulasnella calospora MUT 4182 TaxID=1051891 RepID=A0A0C3LRA6_9AGAM|nr:hypothetical protein M407DRAFT_244612 [Tulasnella calospora MUT 4182]